MKQVFTERQSVIVNRNLDAFTANFGAPRIEKHGGRFFVFTDDSHDWIQECPNLDYLNGWLYGAVQAACGQVRRASRVSTECQSPIT